MGKIRKYIYYISVSRSKSWLKIICESFLFSVKEKELPLYYFMNMCHSECSDDYRNYWGRQKLKAIAKCYTSYDQRLDNKLLFNEYMRNKNIPIPFLLGYVDIDNKYYCNEYNLRMKEFGIELIQNIFDLYEMDELFVKPEEEMGGNGCYKFTKENINIKFINYIKKSEVKYILYKSVKQHEEINKIYSDSVNTIRIYTYKKGTDSEVLISLIRFGANGSNVDNASSGGCFVPIDLDKEELCQYGYRFLKYGAGLLLRHPNSEFKFGGYMIPFCREAKNLALKAAELFDDVIIGWDIAITKEGPLIIEGNSKGSLLMAQIACNGFENSKRMCELLRVIT